MNINEIKKWYITQQQIYFASIELTQNCNFSCKHCYCTEKNSQNLSITQLKKIVDKLYNIKCLFLNFTGGEIFTYKELHKLYIYAKNKGFMIDLVTNGSLINDKDILLFKALPPHNILITLYGTSRQEYINFTGKDTFENVMGTLQKLKNNNISFSLRTVATKTLKSSIETFRFEEIANKFNASFRYDPIIFPKTSGDNSPLSECLSPSDIATLEYNTPLRRKKWKELFKKDIDFLWSCKAGINSMAIDHNGNAYICGLYRHFPISILKEDIHIVLEHLREIHYNHTNIINNNSCSKCSYRHLCKWCPAYSKIYNNNEDKPVEFFCELAKKREELFRE